MSDTREEYDGKVSIGIRNISNLQFYNDIVVLAEDLVGWLFPDVSRRGLVMGSSVRPFVDTILSPQLLQFSRDFDETFQLLLP